MADTTSIASRMEKLAKLKRMKNELSARNPKDQPKETASNTDEALSALSEEAAPPIMDAQHDAAFDPIHTPPPTDDMLEAVFAEAHLDRDESGTPPNDTPPSGDDTPHPFEKEYVGDFTDEYDDLGIPEDLLGPDLEDDDEETPEAHDTVIALGQEPAVAEAPPEEKQTIEPAAEKPHGLNAAELGIDAETMAALDDLLARTGNGILGADIEHSAIEIIEDADAETNASEQAAVNFTTPEIEQEILAHERDRENEREKTLSAPPAGAGTTPDQPGDQDKDLLSITFDDSRTTLLRHVAAQMNCSVDDVVVTAIDWYLDALFGEDEQQESQSA